MLIHQIELSNFKSYAQAVVDLMPGTVAIVGPNGAGKSSLLDAIGLVLFDSQRGTYAERLREGARKGSVRVRLSSSLDQRSYDVTREFSDRTTLRYLVADIELDGRVLAEGADQVTSWLRDHLRVDLSPGLSDLFRATIGVEQGTFTAPFLLPAATRKAQFDPLLQVDAYRAAYEGLRPAQRYLNESQQELSRTIARMEGQLDGLPQRQERLRATEERLAGLIGEIDGHAKAIAAHEPRAAEIEALKQAAQEAQNRARQAESDLQHHEQRLAHARDAVRQAEIAQETLVQSEGGHHAYLAADARLTEMEKQRGARDALRQDRTHHRTELARLRERAEAARANVARGQEARARAQALQPQVEKQGRLEAELRAAEEQAREAASLARQVVDQERQVARESAALEGLQHEAARAAELADQRERIERELVSVGEQRNALAEEIARCRAHVDQIADQNQALQAAAADCPTCEQPLPEGRRRELLARNAQDQSRLQRELAQASDRARELAAHERAHKRRLSELQQALREAPSAREVAGAEQRRAEAHASLEHTRTAYARMGDTAAALAALSAALERLGDPRSEQQAARRAADEASAAAATLEETRAALAATQQQLTALETSLAQYDGLDAELAQARSERDGSRPDHEAYLGARQLAQTLPTAQARLAQMQDALAAARAQRDAAERASERAAAAYDPTEHLRIQRELRDARDRLAAARAQRQSLEDQAQQLGDEIAALEALRGEMASQQAALAQSQATNALLSYVRNLLRDAGPLVTQRLIRRISHQAGEFYAELMGQTDGRLVWGEDYALRLDLGKEQRSFEQLSGGERMAAALAVRMALLRETSAVDVAFFDEPTAHLDSERRESLAERLMSVRGFSQLFVISHDDTFEQAAQSCVRVWRDADGSHVLS